MFEQCRYARYTTDAKAALQLAHDANTKYRAYLPPGGLHDTLITAPQIVDRAECTSYEATLAVELGDASATSLYRELVELAHASDDEDVQWRGRLADGYVRLAYADVTAALADFHAVIERFSPSHYWWDHQRAAEGYLGAGIAELALARTDVANATQQRDQAATQLAKANDRFADIIPRNEDMEPRLRQAYANRLLENLRR